MRILGSKYTYTIISSLLILILVIILVISTRFLYQATQSAFQIDPSLIEAKTIKFDLEGYEQVLPKIKSTN